MILKNKIFSGIGIFLILGIAFIIVRWNPLKKDRTVFNDSTGKVVVFSCPKEGKHVIGGTSKDKYLNEKVSIMRFDSRKAAQEIVERIKVKEASFKGKEVLFKTIKNKQLQFLVDQSLGNKNQKYSDVVLGADCHYYVFQRIGQPVEMAKPAKTRPSLPKVVIKSAPQKDSYDKYAQQSQLKLDQMTTSINQHEQQLLNEQRNLEAGWATLLGAGLQWYQYDQAMAQQEQAQNYLNQQIAQRQAQQEAMLQAQRKSQAIYAAEVAAQMNKQQPSPNLQVTNKRELDNIDRAYQARLDQLLGMAANAGQSINDSSEIRERYDEINRQWAEARAKQVLTPDLSTNEQNNFLSRSSPSYEEKAAAIFAAQSRGNGSIRLNNSDAQFWGGKRIDFPGGGGANLGAKSIDFDRGGSAIISGTQFDFGDGTSAVIDNQEVTFNDGKTCSFFGGDLRCR